MVEEGGEELGEIRVLNIKIYFKDAFNAFTRSTKIY